MFEGFIGSIAGALVGGAVSLWIALLVLSRTRRDNEDLAREQASLAAARQLGLALHQVTSSLSHLDAVPGAEAAARIRRVSDALEVELISYGPALRHERLRESVEKVHDLLHNYRYFAFDSGGAGGWDEPGWLRHADVQVADYIDGIETALVAYRQGLPFELPTKPGWRRNGKEWAWVVAPGVSVDGSITRPKAGWEYSTKRGGWVYR